MALTKRSETGIIYLQAKHFCLWREIKKQVAGCDEVDANNPSTGQTVKKYGYRYDSVSGLAVKLFKYDTEKKYSTRYFGFKLQLRDGIDTYVLDMPYNSALLRRFLRIAPNVDWTLPLSLTVFKGKKGEKDGKDSTGFWFQQQGETVPAYFTRETPYGMPDAVYDADTHEWDFKAQHRWLVDHLKDNTIGDIDRAATAPADAGEDVEPDHSHEPHAPIDDSDLPF